MIRPARPTLAEVPLADLSLRPAISVTVTNVTPLKRENDGSYTTSFTVELYYR
jgi:hypothetical protein